MTDVYGLRGISVASQLHLVDFGKTTKVSAAAKADGLCTVTFDQLDGNTIWLIERVVVSSTSTTPTTCLLYEDTVDAAGLEDGTPSGNLNIDDNSAPILIRGTCALVVVWSGASLNSKGTVKVTYKILRRS